MRTTAAAMLAAKAALAAAEMRVAHKNMVFPAMHDGPQQAAWESKANILIYGGGAGGGKSFYAIADALRGIEEPRYNALLLQRTIAQAKKPGSLVGEAVSLYSQYGARVNRSGNVTFTFPSFATVTIGGMKDEKSRYEYQGTQATRIYFDQLEQFTEEMFWYVGLSRQRRVTGLPTKLVGTANPVDPDDEVGGWLARLLMSGGWVSEETGEAIPEMAGVLRWMYRSGDDAPRFYDSIAEAREAQPGKRSDPKSVTFIPASVEDNPKLMADGEYLGNLEGLPYVDRMRQLHGNWKVSPAGGGLARKTWWRIYKTDPGRPSPSEPERAAMWGGPLVRSWDLAGTPEGAKHAKDRTASVRYGRLRASGIGVFHRPMAGHWSAGQVEEQVVATALDDGPDVVISLPQDPAQAGIAHMHYLVPKINVAMVERYGRAPTVIVRPVRGSKYERAKRWLAELEPSTVNAAGEVAMHGTLGWYDDGSQEVKDAIEQCHQWRAAKKDRDDYVDVISDGYNLEAERRGGCGVY